MKRNYSIYFYDLKAFASHRGIKREKKFAVYFALGFGKPFKHNKRRIILLQPYNFTLSSFEKVIEIVRRVAANCERLSDIQILEFSIKI